MSPPFERRQPIVLDEELLERIADAAADKAVKRLKDDVYRTVGREFINKAMWVIGSVVVGLWVAQEHGTTLIARLLSQK